MNSKMEQIKDRIDDIPDNNDPLYLEKFFARRKKEKAKKEMMRAKKAELLKSGKTILNMDDLENGEK